MWKTRPVCRGECRACVTGAGRCVTDLFCAIQESLEWALWLAPGKSGHVTSSAFAQHRSVGDSLSLKNAFPTQLRFLAQMLQSGCCCKRQTLNSCSVCLSLALKCFAASLRAGALRCSCALAAVTGWHTQLVGAVGHPQSQEQLPTIREICLPPALQASPSFLTLIINYLEAI